MPKPKIAITLETDLLLQLDLWVREGRYPSRSGAIGVAVRELAGKWRRDRLREECAKMDPREARAEVDVPFDGELLPWEGE